MMLSDGYACGEQVLDRLFPQRLPRPAIRQDALHLPPEGGGVVGDEEVAQLVDDDVLHERQRKFAQAQGKVEGGGLGGTATVAGFQGLDADVGGIRDAARGKEGVVAIHQRAHQPLGLGALEHIDGRPPHGGVGGVGEADGEAVADGVGLHFGGGAFDPCDG